MTWIQRGRARTPRYPAENGLVTVLSVREFVTVYIQSCSLCKLVPSPQNALAYARPNAHANVILITINDCMAVEN